MTRRHMRQCMFGTFDGYLAETRRCTDKGGNKPGNAGSVYPMYSMYISKIFSLEGKNNHRLQETYTESVRRILINLPSTTNIFKIYIIYILYIQLLFQGLFSHLSLYGVFTLEIYIDHTFCTRSSHFVSWHHVAGLRHNAANSRQDVAVTICRQNGQKSSNRSTFVPRKVTV